MGEPPNIPRNGSLRKPIPVDCHLSEPDPRSLQFDSSRSYWPRPRSGLILQEPRNPVEELCGVVSVGEVEAEQDITCLDEVCEFPSRVARTVQTVTVWRISIESSSSRCSSITLAKWREVFSAWASEIAPKTTRKIEK